MTARAVQPELFDDGIVRGAEIDGPYRYALWRTWADGGGRVLWVMFNPSTGDGTQDDRTLGRCMDYSQRWGFGGFDVVNLYAVRSPQAFIVFEHPDPVGPQNDRYIAAAMKNAERVVVGWGTLTGPGFHARVDYVIAQAELNGLPLYCLGHTEKGRPKHPLFQLADLPLVRYRRSA